MNFELTEEQQLIAKTAREFATATLAPRAAERDRESLFPEAELHQLGALGLLGVNVPDELGGAQAGAVSYSLALTEIAAADASVAVAMAVTNMVAELIVAFGSDEQKRQYVPRLCSGEAVCGAFALSEPQSGSDAAGMRTTATETAHGAYCTVTRATGTAVAAFAGSAVGVAEILDGISDVMNTVAGDVAVQFDLGDRLACVEGVGEVGCCRRAVIGGGATQPKCRGIALVVEVTGLGAVVAVVAVVTVVAVVGNGDIRIRLAAIVMLLLFRPCRSCTVGQRQSHCQKSLVHGESSNQDYSKWP